MSSDDDAFPPSDATEEPGYLQRFGLGALLLYLVLYAASFPVAEIPAQEDHWDAASIVEWWQGDERPDDQAPPRWTRYPEKWQEEYLEEQDWAVCGFGENVLRLSPEDVAPIRPGGSGDTVYDWTRAALALTLALVLGAGLAFVVSRRSLRCFSRFTHVYVRYGLASTMCVYGFVKLYPMQFYMLHGEGLFGTYGNASPMNMLWSFMGASDGYTMLSGFAEVLGGVLLLFRRTTPFGAALSGAVMSNVLALNLCYDVPVKLFSMHMVLYAGFLLVPSLPRLWAAFFSREAIAADPEPTQPSWLRWPGHVLKTIAIILIVGVPWVQSHVRWNELHAGAKGPLAGVWEVREFESDAPATEHWQRFIVQHFAFRGRVNSVGVVRFTGEDGFYSRVAIDEAARTLTLSKYGGEEFTFDYEVRETTPPTTGQVSESGTGSGSGATTSTPEPKLELVLSGTVGEHAMRTVLEFRSEDSFRINRTEFRWVQQRPENLNMK